MLGYKQTSGTSSHSKILDLRQGNTTSQADDTEYLEAVLAESRDAAVETYGAGSFCVGNVSDDPDVEDVAVIIGDGEIDDGWGKMVDALKLDLSAVSPVQNRLPCSPTHPLVPVREAKDIVL